MKKLLINAVIGGAIGIAAPISPASINEVAHAYSKQDCTANLKHNAPEEFFRYYMRGKTLLTPEDRVTFTSRGFMNDQLYYEGPRYSFISEEYLQNMSEGCKSLPKHQGD